MSTGNVMQRKRRTLASVNPATGELLREYEQQSDEVVGNKLQLAAKTFLEYRKLGFSRRAEMMGRAAEILERRKSELARMMTQEMGKLLTAATQEVEKCAFGCRFYAENAERFLADEEAKTSAKRSFVRYQPL